MFNILLKSDAKGLSPLVVAAKKIPGVSLVEIEAVPTVTVSIEKDKPVVKRRRKRRAAKAVKKVKAGRNSRTHRVKGMLKALNRPVKREDIFQAMRVVGAPANVANFYYYRGAAKAAGIPLA